MKLLRGVFVTIGVAFALFVIVGIIAIATTDSSQAVSSAAVSDSAGQNRQESSNNSGADKAKENTFVKSGMYKVGSNLPPGEYMILATSSSGYWQISSDSSGELDSLVSNENFSRFDYVLLENGDYFTLIGGKAIATSELDGSILDLSKGIHQGTYKIGVDIPAGEYLLIPEPDATMSYWQRTSGVRGTMDEIIANENFDSQQYVTVKSGDYLRIIGASAEPVK